MADLFDSKKIQEFSTQFKKESDRACVIMAAAALDEGLKLLIESSLIKNPSSFDCLFDGANAPLQSFSSKIDLAYSLGLISTEFSSDLHIIRKIRNGFAHNLTGCSFGDQSVHDRVLRLKKSFKIDENNGPRADFNDKSARGDFQYVVTLMLTVFDIKTEEASQFERPKIEFMYQPPNKKDWKTKYIKK